MPAKEKGKCSVFLKKSDMYSETIGPTFNGLKTYPTKFGGCLTILSLIIVLSWLATQFSYIVLFNNATITSSRENIDPTNTGVNPLWNITSSQMILANKIFSLDDSVFPGDSAQYLSALYVMTEIDQDTLDVTFTYYNSTPCENVFFDQNDIRLSYLLGYNCPEVPEGSSIDDFFMPIQGSSSFLGVSDSFGYNF